MTDFWRTRNGLSRIRLALRHLLRSASEDIREGLIACLRNIAIPLGLHPTLKRLAEKFGVKSNASTPLEVEVKRQRIMAPFNVTKPMIFASACTDEKAPGGYKHNGGIKELNLIVKLLRTHGYEAYMVTYDGAYESWLIQHQPHISIGEFRSKLQSAKDVRCVTSWALASAFIRECKQLYFWDMELTYTDHSHFSVLASLYAEKIKNVAAISRTIQAWHMVHFAKSCALLPNLLDESFWYPNEKNRNPFRIGYMYEGAHTEEYMAIVREGAKSEGINLEFFLIEGSEADVLLGMRSCEVFLAMGIGKDPLWGEGCPRTIIEALSAGCVVIAFDTIGNHEVIQSNFNSIIVPRFRPDLMANALIDLYNNPGKIDEFRKNAQSLINCCHTLDSRWPAVEEFLELCDA